MTALLAGAALAVTGCSAQAAEGDDTVTLVLADGFGSTHPVGAGGSQTFVEYVGKHGPEVGLELDYYGAGQLGAPTDMLNLIRTGAVDIGYVIPSYLANEIPLSGIGDLPGLTEDTCRAAEMITSAMQPDGYLYDNELAEWNVQALFGGLIPDLEMMTSSKSVERPEDVRGLLVRSAGGISDNVIEGLGGSPVQLPSGDLYEAIARGTVDGLTTSPYVINSYGLQDEIGYSTRGANLGATSFFMMINHEAWEGLDAAQQKVLTKASAAGAAGVCDSIAEANDAATGTLEKAGIVFNEVEESNRADWQSALTGIREDWVRDLESADVPAEKALTDLEQRLQEENK